jgi:hypothetical protein
MFTNRRYINNNLRVKYATRVFFVVMKKQKWNDDNANNIFNIINNFNIANAIEKIDDDDKFKKSKRDVDETLNVMNDNEIVYRETNVNEDLLRSNERTEMIFKSMIIIWMINEEI